MPTTPPGMRPSVAPEHHVLSPTPARSLQSAVDAAGAESADVDKKIAEVEARLSTTIEELFGKLDRQRVQDVDRLERLINESRAPPAAAEAPQRRAEAAKATATAAAAEQAPRLDPWAWSRAAGVQQLATANAPELATQLATANTALDQVATLRGTGRRGPIKPLHVKDVKEPKVYSGGAQSWKAWGTSFRRFIDARDERLGLLLDKVETLRGKPVTAQHEAEWERDPQLELDPNIMTFKSQLSMFLEEYTGGPVGLIVSQCGKENVLDAWRQLSDQGCSLREKNIHLLLQKAMFPRAEVPDKEIQGAIAEWERDIEIYRRATGKLGVDEDQHKMLLKRMCSLELQKNLRAREPFTPDMAALRQEIADYLAETLPRAKGKSGVRFAALGEKEAEGAAEEEVAGEDWTDEDLQDMSHGQLMALVKNNKLKTPKGKGKGKGKVKTCYECGVEGHIAADCSVRKERVAAGGPERKPPEDVQMGKGDKGGGNGKGGFKGGGGKGLAGKGDGKGLAGKGGKGGWPPKAIWKTLNPDPAVIRNAQWMHWHSYPQTLNAAWEQPTESDWDGPAWLTVPGARLASLTASGAPRGVRGAVAVLADEPLPGETPSTARAFESHSPKDFIKNRFNALSMEGPEDDVKVPHESSCRCNEVCGTMKVNLADAIRMPSRNKLKTERRMRAFEGSKHRDLCKSSCDGMGACDDADPGAVQMAWPGLRVLTEKRPHSLMPLAGSNDGGWEHFEAILDSGATVTVIPPHVGRDYEVVPGAASKAGVRYEVANGEEIPNLGEKLLPVVTNEGSWRGMVAQVADVTKALQSVRALVRAGHVVVFGDGDCGADHYIYNKVTGETNFVKDDGVNYLMSLHIAPRAEAGFGRPVPAR